MLTTQYMQNVMQKIKKKTVRLTEKSFAQKMVGKSQFEYPTLGVMKERQ